MAITSLDGALAGMQPPVFFTKASVTPSQAGTPFSLWPIAGQPSSGLYNATAGGAILTSTTGYVQGMLYHTNPGSGNAYLARFEALMSGAGGVLILADRLLTCGVTSTGAISVAAATASSLNTGALPARDSNGTTAGIGVLIGLEVQTVLAGAGGQVTFGYTNSTGTVSHSAVTFSTTGNIPAAAVAGSFFMTGLAAGDIGVASIQTLTISTAWTSGAIQAVLYRPITSLEIPSSGVPNAVDALTSGFPQLFNGAVPFLIFIPNSVNATSIVGSLSETQG